MRVIQGGLRQLHPVRSRLSKMPGLRLPTDPCGHIDFWSDCHALSEINMNRRGILSSALLGPLLSGCFPNPTFDIGWDEQVLLNGGQVVIGHINYTYERLGTIFSLNKYEPSILRATELSFRDDSLNFNFKQRFLKHRVNTLQKVNDKWYLVLETRGGPIYTYPHGRPRELWGEPQDGAGHKCVRVDSTDLVPVSIEEFSDAFLMPNILMGNAGAEILSKFNGSTVTLQQKAEYLKKYPLDPDEIRIKSSHNSLLNMSGA